MPDVGLAKVQESIAANVRRLRIRQGLTQERLAEVAELDLRLLQRVEAASTNMKIAVVVSLARALQVAPGALMRPASMPARPRGRPQGFPGRSQALGETSKRSVRRR